MVANETTDSLAQGASGSHREGAVPGTSSTRHAEKLRFLLQYGMLAPSQGPHSWRLVVTGDAIEVWAAHGCSLPLLDPSHRELIIGCGVALAQLRMALQRLGASLSVDTLPDGAQPALLARVRVEDFGRASPDAYALFSALARWDDRRERTSRDEVSRETLAELETIATEERTILRWVNATEYVADVVTAPSLRGAECTSERVANVVAALHPLRRREFDPSTREWTEASECSLRAAVVCVIAAQGDTAHEWLAAGQALGRALIRARVDGLHHSFRDATTDIERLRGRLRQIPRAAIPQVLFRLGYPESPEVLRVEIPRYKTPATARP
jgi:hypothetical protein